MTTPQHTATATRKLGSNRGKTRLWIEGVLLSSMDWTQGRKFKAEFDAAARRVSFIAHPEGPRKVAGTDARPIIDTNTDKLAETLGINTGDTVQVTVTAFRVDVEPFDKDKHGKAESMKDHAQPVARD